MGSDRLDLAGLLRGIGYVGSNPLGDGYVGFIPTGANTLLTIDADGSAGPGVARSFVLLQAVTPTRREPSQRPVRDCGQNESTYGTPA